ncbi:hypothetical protein SNE40_009703 [Patella caerulea]|uniref:Uncharacterized protein n=1 Tax=Patella caerulea TaxID=87958 RepID=A0AAN8JSQ1_PATCE
MKSSGLVHNWNNQPFKRPVDTHKRRKHEDLKLENVQIAQRLEAVRPYYDRHVWKDDFKKHEHYREMRQKSHKDYYETPSKKNKQKI